MAETPKTIGLSLRIDTTELEAFAETASKLVADLATAKLYTDDQLNDIQSAAYEKGYRAGWCDMDEKLPFHPARLDPFKAEEG